MPTEYANNRFLGGISHVLLPLNLLVEATGGPASRTAISQADGGLEYRKAKRPMPLREWSVSFGPNDVPAIQSLFYCQIGPAKCFMMRDPIDYQAVVVPLEKQSSGGNTFCQLRQKFATVNWFTSSELTADITYRDITLPDPTTLLVYEDGGPSGGASGWTLGADGLISKSGTVSAAITASVNYFTPVRFTNDRLDIGMHGGITDANNVLASLATNSVQKLQLTEVLPKPAVALP